MPEKGQARGNASDPAGEAFWRFSLALYARPGVADALLALQDRAGRDVNLILFGLWIGTWRGRELGAAAFAEAEAATAEVSGLVAGLRALRRPLKGSAGCDVRALRRRLLRLELDAERRVQLRLAERFADRPSPGPERDRRAAAEANLALYLGSDAESPEAELLRRSVAALTRRAEARPAPPGPASMRDPPS